MYDSPGLADILSKNLIEKWNQVISEIYDQLKNIYGSQYFIYDPDLISEPVLFRIKWFADPAELKNCVDPESARKLCDWDTKGRHYFHNEYCEYTIIYKADNEGKIRPKRVQITTELREYWITLAMYDPDLIRELAQSILEVNVPWRDLYGVDDPFSLTLKERKISFCRHTAGNGLDPELLEEGVPVKPLGKINTENALFMTHPINGLDDLFFIVMYGAHPYASIKDEKLEKASKEQIFRREFCCDDKGNLYTFEELCCRHSDPAASMSAYNMVFEGRSLSFFDPIGVYILSFSRDHFSFRNAPVPIEWIKLGRGKERAGIQMYQRLEFGPSDEDPYFLDDIEVTDGNHKIPLSGGYDILNRIEVGTIVSLSKRTTIPNINYEYLFTNNSPIICRDSHTCEDIERLKKEYETNNLSNYDTRQRSGSNIWRQSSRGDILPRKNQTW